MENGPNLVPWIYDLPSGYLLYIATENPSISMGHLYHGYVK